MRRFGLLTALCSLLVAQQTTVQQQPPQQPPKEPAQQQQPDNYRIGVTVENVVVPTLVFDRDGNYVPGVRPDQFHLFDNGKEQDIHVDETFTPISLVIAIQSNAQVQAVLPQIQKIGNLISPLILGDQGEAALIAYDSRIRTLQNFTHDPDLITKQIKSLYPGSYSNCMVDAVVEGTRLLSSRPKDRRRILLMIGETRDVGSSSKPREALIGVQINNITVYAVDMSRFLTTLTAPAKAGRPDNNPPALHQLPGITPTTPTTVAQTYGANAGRVEFIPLMMEVLKDVKYVFKDNPIELLTKGTGGSEFGFHSNRTLEEAIQHLAEELHSDYTISYAPNNREEGGFHQITVEVTGHPEVKRVQVRPGYWLATKQ